MYDVSPNRLRLSMAVQLNIRQVPLELAQIDPFLEQFVDLSWRAPRSLWNNEPANRRDNGAGATKEESRLRTPSTEATLASDHDWCDGVELGHQLTHQGSLVWRLRWGTWAHHHK